LEPPGRVVGVGGDGRGVVGGVGRVVGRPLRGDVVVGVVLGDVGERARQRRHARAGTGRPGRDRVRGEHLGAVPGLVVDVLGGVEGGGRAGGVVRDHRLDQIPARVQRVGGGAALLVGGGGDQPVQVVGLAGGEPARVGGHGGPVVEVVGLPGEVAQRVGDAGPVPDVVVPVAGLGPGRAGGRR